MFKTTSIIIFVLLLASTGNAAEVLEVEATTAPALGQATVQDSVLTVDHSQLALRRVLFTGLATDLFTGQGGWMSTAGSLLSLASCPTPGQIPQWSGSAWGCATGIDLPSGGAVGDILMITESGPAWVSPTEANIVTSEPPAE